MFPSRLSNMYSNLLHSSLQWSVFHGYLARPDMLHKEAKVKRSRSHFKKSVFHLIKTKH